MAKNVSQADRGAAKWRKILEAQRQSGQSVEAFCRTHRLGESTFYFWRRALNPRKEPLARSRPASSTGNAAFVPVRVAATAESMGRLDIRLPNGLCVRVTPPVDGRALAAVLAVLTKQTPEAEGRGC
jgi:transposase-like protein